LFSKSTGSEIRISNDPTDYEYVIPGAILMDGLLHSFCLGFVLALGLKYWEEYAEDSIRKRAFVLTVVFLSLCVLRRLHKSVTCLSRRCSLQTILEDYKVWTVAVFHKSWVSLSQIFNAECLNGIKAGSPFLWTDFFLNGAICSMCEAFYIRRCWKVRSLLFLIVSKR
jgi:hypothetical protein